MVDERLRDAVDRLRRLDAREDDGELVAAQAVSRTQPTTRRAASRSSWSPCSWPSVSLTSLKWSRSISISTMACPERCAALAAMSSRSLNMRRLGSSVSESKLAWRQIAAS